MYSDDHSRYVWIASDNPAQDWINRAITALQSPVPPPIDPTPPQRQVTDSDWVTTAGAFFAYRGKPLVLNGVNYWPLSHNGKAPGEFAPHWLEPSWFDPAIISHDLDQLQRLNINAVSIQYHEVSQAPQLRWFVNACRLRGIWVHCFIGYLQPLDQDLAKAEALIRAADIPNLPGLFAIDIAWEPHLGLFDQRGRFNPHWEQWLQEHYGSLEQARRVLGRTAGPTDDELRSDQGPHLPLVNAYRQFVDEYFGQRYAAVARFVRELGCRQLLSARTGYGGNGNHWADPFLPLDLGTGAEHFDFICPEGYALTGDLDQFNEGCFITAYARAVSGGKPVVWMEYGCSVSADPQAADLENQARLFRNMHHLLRRSSAAGAFAWWYPGGWRVDEKSDMGLIAPNNQPRPAARLLAQAERFPAPINDSLPPLLIDPSQHATGLSGLWDQWRETFRREMREVRITPPSR
jgi:hypothetical protein